MKLEYIPTNSMAEVSKLLQTEGQDFVEGIMFGLKKTVVMFGNFSDHADPNKARKNGFFSS